ncbi:hypothetical protein CPB84DRAFT_1823982 [Gymnopilus junonius]|uniref:F-box domain-containing protein n=1 Tax=Gymnopilus junonius TaxID=109634 RepID=A0A9P5NR04_GYMJU|nr:hypothetical protein CPB84DRAFT_1823982 [Gymnopilus junonius]
MGAGRRRSVRKTGLMDISIEFNSTLQSTLNALIIKLHLTLTIISFIRRLLVSTVALAEIFRRWMTKNNMGHARFPTANLVTHISNAKSALEDLLIQRQELKGSVNQFHSSVFHVPLEVTTYIFQLYIDDQEVPDDPPAHIPKFRKPSPLILGAVCHSWHRIALSIPRLWTNISIQLCEEKAEGQSQLVCDWLKRSGEFPVSIELSSILSGYDHTVGDKFPDELPTLPFLPMINAINECSHRWKRLACIKLPPAFCNLLCGNLQGTPLLDSLTIQDAPSYGEIKFHLKAGKPSPKTIGISDLYLCSFDVDFSRVTTIIAGGITFSDILDVIRSAPLLKTCTWVDGYDFEYFEPSGQIPFVHSELETFSLETSLHEDCLRLLDYLTLPALQSLSCDFYGEDCPTTSLKSFLERSCCRLLAVKLSGIAMKKDELVDLVQLLPAVQNASIIQEKFSINEFQPFYTCLLTDSELLPAVSSLHIAVDTGFNWTDLASFVYYDMESHRMKRPLRVLKIRSSAVYELRPRYISRDRLKLIQKLKDQGIEVSVGGPDDLADFIAQSEANSQKLTLE